MIRNDLLTGRLVHLAAVNVEEYAGALAKWFRDSEFSRLMDSDPARMYSEPQVKNYFKRVFEKDDPTQFYFNIRTLKDDRLIGDIELDGILWNHGDAFVGIAIGDRSLWGRGYGTDAMEIILRFAFTELNLHRISLNVFEYNPRAIRSYQKAGFTYEGRVRDSSHRDGRHWDLIFMGITTEEWLLKFKSPRIASSRME